MTNSWLMFQLFWLRYIMGLLSPSM
jgi:hypothetical protein